MESRTAVVVAVSRPATLSPRSQGAALGGGQLAEEVLRGELVGGADGGGLDPEQAGAQAAQGVGELAADLRRR
jgi:hypothetical protein